MGNEYHESRLTYDPKREILWKTLVTYYFQKMISEDAHVLELGAGYCDFINHVKANKKMALDLWPGVVDYAANDVECVVSDIAGELDISDNTLDFVFASNIFEHISQEKLAETLLNLKKKLKKTSTLCILQPNYRFAYKEYFDDYTHVSIWSDVSLSDFLHVNGFRVRRIHPGFLPLSIKSRLPTHPWLIRAYLKSPIKPLAKQMLLFAEPVS